MSATAVQAETPVASDRRVWLSKPALDLVVGCGAWSAPLLALVYVLGARYDASIALGFYALSLVCNYPHYMATLYRAYRTWGEAARYKLFTVHATVLLALTAAFVHWSPGWAPLFFTVFITWSPWHYTGQNFGIAMMFAQRAGAEPSRAERNWLRTAFVASYAMIFVAIHTGASEEPYVRSLGIPQGLATATSALCFLLFAVASARALWPMVARTSARRMAAVLTIVSTQFLWFVLPTALIWAFDSRLQRTSYSVGVLAFMHCAQYLWITSYYAKREAAAGDGSRWRPWVYAVSLVAGGIALFLPGPWIVSSLFHYDFTASFLIFSSLVNIHHFVVDGAIWKLRDGRVARLLLGRREESTEEPRERRAWTEGWPAAARLARAAVVVALVGLGAVDVARFAWSLDRSNAASLERAARLTPFDVSVRTSIAKLRAAAGNIDDAVRTLEGAVAVDPYDATAQRALAHLLLENGRYEEAYRQHASMVRYVPADVDTLVNYGTLAAQFGHDDEAASALSRALAIDDAQPRAHLQLAEALSRLGRTAEAIPHYERYIVLAGAQPDTLGDPKQLAGVLIALGDAYGQQRRLDQSATYYAKAAEFAARAGAPNVEGTAYGRLASLYESAGRTKEAAAAYVRAIERDAAGEDPHAVAIDWFNYGQFLRKQQAPADLVAACLAEARDGLATASEATRTAVDQALTTFERDHPSALGAAADRAAELEKAKRVVSSQ